MELPESRPAGTLVLGAPDSTIMHQCCCEPLRLGSAAAGHSQLAASAGEWGKEAACRASWPGHGVWPFCQPRGARAAPALSSALCGWSKPQGEGGALTERTHHGRHPQGPLLPGPLFPNPPQAYFSILASASGPWSVELGLCGGGGSCKWLSEELFTNASHGKTVHK